MLITLPFPPSVNTYWRHPSSGPSRGKHLISERGRAYRKAIIDLAWTEGFRQMTGPLVVVIEAWMPDKRKRDLDNLPKAIFDSLTHAGIWEDDSQVVDFRIFKAPMLGGMVKVNITQQEQPT